MTEFVDVIEVIVDFTVEVDVIVVETVRVSRKTELQKSAISFRSKGDRPVLS